jgi:hypothetical protein
MASHNNTNVISPVTSTEQQEKERLQQSLQQQQQTLLLNSNEFTLSMKDGSLLPFEIVDSNNNSSSNYSNNYSPILDSSQPVNINYNSSSDNISPNSASSSSLLVSSNNSTETSPTKFPPQQQSIYPLPSYPQTTLPVSGTQITSTTSQTASTQVSSQLPNFPHPHTVERERVTANSLLLDGTNASGVHSNTSGSLLSPISEEELSRKLSSNPKPLPSVPKPSNVTSQQQRPLQPLLFPAQHTQPQTPSQQHALLQQLPSVPTSFDANNSGITNAVNQILERREERRMGMSMMTAPVNATSGDSKQSPAQVNTLSGQEKK